LNLPQIFPGFAAFVSVKDKAGCVKVIKVDSRCVAIRLQTLNRSIATRIPKAKKGTGKRRYKLGSTALSNEEHTNSEIHKVKIK